VTAKPVPHLKCLEVPSPVLVKNLATLALVQKPAVEVKAYADVIPKSNTN